MGARPYQQERAKSPMGREPIKAMDKSVMLPRKGANIYSDNGFIFKHNNLRNTPNKNNIIR